MFFLSFGRIDTLDSMLINFSFFDSFFKCLCKIFMLYSLFTIFGVSAILLNTKSLKTKSLVLHQLLIKSSKFLAKIVFP